MTVLADTSIWVEFLRHRGRRVKHPLGDLIAHNRIVMCGPIAAELIGGLGDDRSDELRDLLDQLPWAPLGRRQWHKVGATASALRRRGQRVALTDLAIAVAGADVGAAIWTLDRDFDRIAAVLDGFERYHV